ncbi:MAG TPA: urea ABC transporter permease subunit UrtB [Caldimonas sp.]
MRPFFRVFLLGLACIAGAARAMTPEQALAMAAGDNDARIAAVAAVAAAGDPKLQGFVQAMLGGELKVAGDRVLVVQGEKVTDAASGAVATLPETAEDVTNNNRMRGALEATLATLRLLSPEVAVRRAAVDELIRASLDESQLPLVEKALAAETDADLKARLERMHATLLVASSDRMKRLAAVDELASSSQSSVANLLQERLAAGGEGDPEVRAALGRALDAVRARLAWGERLAVVFTGISLGSVLLLVALGLAITYGLMGVINMAHGELMMIGAYTTYLVQNAFRAFWPAAFDAYVVVAIPAAFLVSALVGAVLERGVIRFLYGRPLETLLATWGISLVLQQAVRSIFGAQNVRIENPAWMSGGVEVMSNLVLPYNRIAIIAFAFVVLGAVALLIARTRFGLFIRGVTQNRRMASCVGVDTAKIDMLAFSFGAGIAGLGGVALSQIGNVGPDLGQSYIVDSFLVVVVGGVGQLAGTVVAGLGLGVLNKLFEGVAGAVLAKIAVLVLIVIFIQRKPSGLFAIKGRSAEA